MYTPYPFERLPKLTRTQVRALSQLSSLFSGTDLALAQRAAEALIGLALSSSVGLPGACFGRDVAARTQAVWIELTLADAAGLATELSVWLELPLGFCELLIERTLGGDGALGMLSSGGALDELRLGALAYLVARACAAAGPRFRLQTLRSSAPPLTDATLVRVPVSIVCQGEAAVLQFYAPVLLLHDARSTRSALRALPEVTLALSAEAGFARLDLATLRSLHAGDVIVLQHTGLWRECEDAEFQGAIDVRVRGSATVLHCQLHDGRLEVETIACSAEPSMTSGRRIPEPNSDSPSESDGVIAPREHAENAAGSADLARDAPIEVTLEIARFQLRLDELERVRPGDVLVTGRRVGEAVTLRAANQAFAEGELVDVEGELGVRITRILGE
jgi:type III secretion system YscQ/HrcQ family protein